MSDFLPHTSRNYLLLLLVVFGSPHSENQHLSSFHQEKDFEECSAQPQNAQFTGPAFTKHRDCHFIHLEGDFAFGCLLGHS